MLPLYEKYKASTGIHDIAGEIKAGMMYIALRKRQPLANPRALFWKIWTWQERNAPWILKVLPSITARTPFALEARRLVSHQYDGHAYVRQALDNGASCAVVDNPRYVFDSRCFLVPDVGKALMGLAAYHRSQLKIPVIGISGSVGKSTTVKLAAAVLAQKHMVFFNLRNDALGLYISFLQMPANTEVAVLELATVFPGMLRDHCNRLRPSHGLLTHVGLAHQGTLGSIEGIQAAKWELYDFLIDNQGFTYLNVNHGWLASQTDRLHEAVTFGASEQAAVRGEIVSADPFLKLRLYSPEGSPPGAIEIQTSLAGAYNLDNILAAVAIGRSFGVPEADMIQTL